MIAPFIDLQAPMTQYGPYIFGVVALVIVMGLAVMFWKAIIGPERRAMRDERTEYQEAQARDRKLQMQIASMLVESSHENKDASENHLRAAERHLEASKINHQLGMTLEHVAAKLTAAVTMLSQDHGPTSRPAANV